MEQYFKLILGDVMAVVSRSFVSMKLSLRILCLWCAREAWMVFVA